MKTKTKKTLPKIPEQIANGSIHTQQIKCGKDKCKCSRGETHTGHYFFTRIEGKLEKFYICKDELKAFSKIVREAQTARESERRSRQFANDILKSYRTFLTDNEKTMNQIIGEFI